MPMFFMIEQYSFFEKSVQGEKKGKTQILPIVPIMHKVYHLKLFPFVARNKRMHVVGSLMDPKFPKSSLNVEEDTEE